MSELKVRAIQSLAGVFCLAVALVTDSPAPIYGMLVGGLGTTLALHWLLNR